MRRMDVEARYSCCFRAASHTVTARPAHQVPAPRADRARAVDETVLVRSLRVTALIAECGLVADVRYFSSSAGFFALHALSTHGAAF